MNNPELTVLLEQTAFSCLKFSPFNIYVLGAVFLITFCCLVLVAFYFLSRYYKKENEIAMIQHQSDMIEKYILQRERSDEMIRILSHDLKHHLQVWQTQAEAAGAAETVKDIETYNKRLKNYDLIDVNNEIANALLNYKNYECLKSGVVLSVKGVFYPDLTLSRIDMAALIGNLLDNAFEAAIQADDNALRKIVLQIKREKHFLVIKISNGCKGEPVKENGVYVSTKPKWANHGMGMISIDQVLKDYYGSIRTGFAEGIFNVTIMLRGYSNND